MTVIDYRQFFSPKPSGFNSPVFHELTLCQQIIKMQKQGRTLREISILLKKKKAEIDDTILAWLREY